MTAGRPNKYGENTKLEHYAIPLSLVEYLGSISQENNVSKTELVVNALMMSDKDILKKLTLDINSLRENYKLVSKNYEDLSKKLNSSTFSMIYQDIEEDEKLNYFLKEFKTSHIKWIKNGITENELIQQYESWLYEKYKLGLKNKSLIKVILKNWITKVLKE